MTKYLDFTFSANGVGNRDETPFRWELAKKGNKEELKISWIRQIDKGEYNNIRSNADEMMPEGGNATTYIISGKKQRVIADNGSFYLVTGMEIFKVASINNLKLVLSVKSTGGKTVKTYHTKF